jgi:hypothetical protein
LLVKEAMKNYIVLTFLIAMIISCATGPSVPINLYDIDKGNSIKGRFIYTGPKGPVRFPLANGDICEGEYLTLDDRYSAQGAITQWETQWGRVYVHGANGWSDAALNNFAPENIVVPPNSYLGSAILFCPQKRTVTCEYIVNRNNQGSGYCKDTHGSRYNFNY